MTLNIVSRTIEATSFPPELSSVPAARRWIRKKLVGHTHDFVDDAELLGSEIVTNAVRHGHGRVAVTIAARDTGLRFEVLDEGSGTEPRTPETVVPDGLAEGGWGLQLLDLMTSSWGSHKTADGNRVVWYELAFPLTHETTPASDATAEPGS